MPPAVVAATLLGGAAVHLGVMNFGMALLGVGSTYYMDRQARKAQERQREQLNSIASQMAGVITMFREVSAHRNVVYGKDVRISGNIIFAHVKDERWLYLVIGLAEHELSEEHSIYVDDLEITDIGVFGDWNYANGGQFVNSLYWKWYPTADKQSNVCGVLNSELPTFFTPDYHEFANFSYAVVKLYFEASHYPNGVPNISFRCHGKKCYDPRSLTWGHTDNNSLIVRNYLLSESYGNNDFCAGLGVSASDLNEQSFIDSANKCDEIINGEKRYRTKAVFLTDVQPQEIISRLEDCSGGALTSPGGYYTYDVAEWKTPVIDLNEDDLRGFIEVVPSQSISEIFNEVKGIYIDEYDQPSDYPAVSASAYEEIDGRPITLTMSLPYVPSPHQAQRVARIALERSRQEAILKYPCSIRALKLVPGDNVRVTNSRLGYSNKYFEVLDVEQIEEEVETGVRVPRVNLVLKETDPTIFDDQDTYDIDPSPNTNLPSAFEISPPMSLSVSENLIRVGDVVENEIHFEWTEPQTYFLSHYEAEYKKSSHSTWLSLGTCYETRRDFVLNETGSFDFRVRAVNPNVKSEWTKLSAQTILGKTAPPEDVEGFTATITDYDVILSWDPVSDLDLSEYVVRESGSSWDWDLVTIEKGRTKGTQLKEPLVTQFDDPTQHAAYVSYTYHRKIKALDTSGNYSENASACSYTIVRPVAPIDFTVETIGIKVVMSWKSSKQTLPIHHYNVYRGDSFATAELLAQPSSPFYAYDEPRPGPTTYHVYAVDNAGNCSYYASFEVEIPTTKEYKFYGTENNNSWAEGTKTNFAESWGQVIPGVPHETWSQHFERAGATTVQDLIDSGFTHYLQPIAFDPAGLTVVAEYEWIVDLGAVIPSSMISISVPKTVLDQDITVAPTISVRETTGDSWDDSTGKFQVFQNNFQYVKLHLAYYAETGRELIDYGGQQVTMTVNIRRLYDSGSFSGLGAHYMGDVVTFNLDFIDVDNIQVTCNGSSKLLPVIEFVDAPNPTQFLLRVYDMNTGNQVDAAGFWTAEGV